MPQRTFPPYRADHVGSLLRPPYLLQARADFAAGRISAESLRETEDKAVDEVVALQEGIGLSTATDGEFRRGAWHMDFLYQLDGVSSNQDAELTVEFHNADGDLAFTTPEMRVSDRIGLSRTVFAEDFRYLAARTSSATAKITLPSPGMVEYRAGRAAISQEVYPDLAEFRSDLGSAYASEISALGELGCRYLQLDDTSLAYLNDPAQREQFAARGGESKTQHLRTIELMNAALSGRPRDMAVTTHMCRGNYRSSWAAEGSYEYVAEALFNELDVDGYFMEFDDERSGGFEPLRFVPKGKAVVLGLVTTKKGELESKDVLKRRIEEASRFVDIDQLCLSPQCGFASTQEGNALTYDEQVAKLELIAETAGEVWG